MKTRGPVSQSHAEELVFTKPEAVATSMNTLAVWESRKKNDCLSNINKKHERARSFPFDFAALLTKRGVKNRLSVNDVRISSDSTLILIY